jgi:hypothetical protein
VLVGQTVTLNFRVSPDVVVTESVTVVGDTRLVDTRTSEVTTKVPWASPSRRAATSSAWTFRGCRTIRVTRPTPTNATGW